MLPDGVEAVTGDDAADEAASDLLQAISFLTTFLLIFAGISLVVGAFLIVNTFSILVAQRSRELALLRALGASKRQVVWSVQLEAFVLGVRRRDPRPRPRRAAGDGDPRAVRELRPRPLRPAADLRAAHRSSRRTPSASWSPWSRRGCRPGAPAGSRRCRRCATTSRCPSRRCAAGCVVGTALVVRRRWSCCWLGLFSDLPHGGWQVGGGVLAILLGVAAAEPGDRAPVPGAGPARCSPGSSAPSATSPGRTRCATRGVRPPPPRR